MLGAGVGALAWFLLTPPLAITSVQRVHRTWLALAGVFVLLLAVLGLLRAGAARLRSLSGRHPPPGR
jgi:hypothetical protein